MPKVKASVYDTRFFLEFLYTPNRERLDQLKQDLLNCTHRIVSVVTIHELYRISLLKEGRQVAQLRTDTIKKDFDVVTVNFDLAVQSAEIKHKYNVPMADSIIAATAYLLKCSVVSDDPHFSQIKEIPTRWIKSLRT